MDLRGDDVMFEVYYWFLVLLVAFLEVGFYKLMNEDSRIVRISIISDVLSVIVYIVFQNSFEQTRFIYMLFNVGFLIIFFSQLTKIYMINTIDSSNSRVASFFSIVMIIVILATTTLIS